MQPGQSYSERHRQCAPLAPRAACQLAERVAHIAPIRDEPDLDVGVIFTNETDLMPPLLASLSRSGDDLSMRLILIDNASGAGTKPWETYFPQTITVRNAERLGYADNLNRILAQATARYVLLLNTDMSFDPAEQCAAKMVDFMERHVDCGIAGCRLYHADNSYAYPARRFQSLRTIAARRLGFEGLFPDEIDRYLYLERSPFDVFECDWLSGCFLMVRRLAVEQVGLLDSGFTKYFEDVDLCLRMALAGWRVMFNGQTYCYHLEQRASTRLLSWDAWVHLRSYVRWLRKWGFDPQGRVVQDRTRKSKAA